MEGTLEERPSRARMLKGHGHVWVAAHVLHRHRAGELLEQDRHTDHLDALLQAAHQDLQRLPVHPIGDGRDQRGDPLAGDEIGKCIAITENERTCGGAAGRRCMLPFNGEDFVLIPCEWLPTDNYPASCTGSPGGGWRPTI